MLGIIDDTSKAARSTFKNDGDIIAVVGSERSEMGGSEYLKVIHDVAAGKIPPIDYKYEKSLHEFLREAVQSGLLNSAHDISEGGLAVTIAECCIMDNEKIHGAKASFSSPMRNDFALFAEGGGRVVVSFDSVNADRVISLARSKSLPIKNIGVVGGKKLELNGILNIDVQELATIYFSVLPSKFAVSFAV